MTVSSCVKQNDKTCLTFDGLKRCWELHIPEGKLENIPLIIDLHGWQSSPQIHREISGFDKLALNEKVFVAWPYGIKNSWNAGKKCCEPASITKVDDVGFLKSLITKLVQDNPIDVTRIYVSGFSNGCAMAQRLAVEASDLITAVACMSLSLLVSVDKDYNYNASVPVMVLMGEFDELYDDPTYVGAINNFNIWKRLNNCSDDYSRNVKVGYVIDTYQYCENDSEISLVTVVGNHTLYSGYDTDVDTTKLAWEFMSRFQKDF